MLGPLARFNETIDRCYRLVDHHKAQSHVGRPGQHLADVLRGTIVLACAALDALNEELLVRALPQAQRRGLLGGAAPTIRASRELVVNVLGAAAPWATAAAELTRDTRRPWTGAEVRDALSTLVQRRNAIAHKGDLRASGRSESIRRSRVEADILLTYEIGRAIRDVIRQRL